MVGSAKRERELARQRHERQQTRREVARRQARVRQQVIASAVSVIVVIGGMLWLTTLLGGDRKESAKAQAASSPSPSVSTAAHVCPDPAPGTRTQQSFAKEPPLSVDRVPYLATITTNCGTVQVEMNAVKAPHTVSSFAFLAGKKFFDHTPCHRLTTEGIFVLQCGDPTGTGSGGPGYRFTDENLKGAQYEAGTVAMANSGPNTNGSQFFIVYDKSELGPNYTPFGKVTQGLDVIKKIAKAGASTPGDGPPNQAVVIESFTVKPKS